MYTISWVGRSKEDAMGLCTPPSFLFQNARIIAVIIIILKDFYM